MNGYKGRDYWTDKEMVKIADAHLWMGMGTGMFVTIVIQAVAVGIYGWLHNWF